MEVRMSPVRCPGSGLGVEGVSEISVHITTFQEAAFVDKVRACKLLDISVKTFERWLADGTMPRPYAFGRHRKWRVDDLLRATERLRCG